MEGKRISLCMIVKNEEQWIENCLKHVQPWVDEIIIVDTGSTDKTREISKRMGAEVFDFIWRDNFAKARNYSVSQATGDWILFMDADEELEITDKEQWEAMFRAEQAAAMAVHVENYYGTFPPTANKAYHMLQHRIFRHQQGIRFVNRIHERLDIPQGLLSERVVKLPAVIHHYGYLDPVVDKKQKAKRNMRILELEQQNPDRDPWMDYHLAGEYYGLGQYELAFEQLNKAIKRFLERNVLPPSMAYKLKYDIMLTAGTASGAWPGIEKAIELYPDYVDLHYYRGVILYSLKRYSDAEAALRTCLELGDRSSVHLTLRGTGSFHALYLLGRCYEAMGKVDAARLLYAEVLEICPDYVEATEDLARLSGPMGEGGRI